MCHQFGTGTQHSSVIYSRFHELCQTKTIKEHNYYCFSVHKILIRFFNSNIFQYFREIKMFFNNISSCLFHIGIFFCVSKFIFLTFETLYCHNFATNYRLFAWNPGSKCGFSFDQFKSRTKYLSSLCETKKLPHLWGSISWACKLFVK